MLSRSPVLFSNNVARNDDALGIFRDYDEPSYEDIRRNFVYWDDVEILYKDRRFRCASNGFAGCSRVSLLFLLQQRCRGA